MDVLDDKPAEVEDEWPLVHLPQASSIKSEKKGGNCYQDVTMPTKVDQFPDDQEEVLGDEEVDGRKLEGVVSEGVVGHHVAEFGPDQESEAAEGSEKEEETPHPHS